MRKHTPAEELNLTQLNQIIARNTGKADLRLRESGDSNYCDVYWAGNKLDMKAIYFLLPEEDGTTDDISDRIMLRFYVTVTEDGETKAVYFDFLVSTEFTAKDLEYLYDESVKVLKNATEGEYSLGDLTSEITKKYFSVNDASLLYKNIDMCKEPVLKVLPSVTTTTVEELTADGMLEYYIPRQMIFRYKNGEYTYLFVNPDSCVFYLVSGQGEDGVGTELLKVAYIDFVDLYKEKIDMLTRLIEGGSDYATEIVNHLPNFGLFVE